MSGPRRPPPVGFHRDAPRYPEDRALIDRARMVLRPSSYAEVAKRLGVSRGALAQFGVKRRLPLQRAEQLREIIRAHAGEVGVEFTDTKPARPLRAFLKLSQLYARTNGHGPEWETIQGLLDAYVPE